MTVEPTVAWGLVRAYLNFAVGQGADEKQLAARAGVEIVPDTEHDRRVPFSRYVALLRESKAACDDAALPMRFAEAVDPSAFSVVGLLANAAETMAEALEQINRYTRLVAEIDCAPEGRWLLEQKNGAHWCIDTRRDPGSCPEITEVTFTQMICGPRRFLPRPHVLEAQVTHKEPKHRDAYDRIWRVPVMFGAARNALRIDPDIYGWSVRQHPRFVFGVLCAHADSLLRELDRSKTRRGEVEKILTPILHTGDVGVDAVARRMGVSRQTLWRDLKSEGVTFGQILDDLRRTLALDYLANRRVTVNETAYLVGFSDAAAFSRAFKRWTGTSPGRVGRLGSDAVDSPCDEV